MPAPPSGGTPPPNKISQVCVWAGLGLRGKHTSIIIGKAAHRSQASKGWSMLLWTQPPYHFLMCVNLIKRFPVQQSLQDNPFRRAAPIPAHPPHFPMFPQAKHSQPFLSPPLSPSAPPVSIRHSLHVPLNHSPPYLPAELCSPPSPPISTQRGSSAQWKRICWPLLQLYPGTGAAHNCRIRNG